MAGLLLGNLLSSIVRNGNRDLGGSPLLSQVAVDRGSQSSSPPPGDGRAPRKEEPDWLCRPPGVQRRPPVLLPGAGTMVQARSSSSKLARKAESQSPRPRLLNLGLHFNKVPDGPFPQSRLRGAAVSPASVRWLSLPVTRPAEHWPPPWFSALGASSKDQDIKTVKTFGLIQIWPVPVSGD